MLTNQTDLKKSHLAMKASNESSINSIGLPKMSNLTEQVVISEVREMLASPIYLPYSQLLAGPSLQAWLVNYAMRRINSFCVVIQRPESFVRDGSSTLALIQRPKVRQVLDAGFQFLKSSIRVSS